MSDFFKSLRKLAQAAKVASQVAEKVHVGAERVQGAAEKAEVRLASELCPFCGEPAVEGLALCPAHLSAAARVAKKYAG